jgi:hypothetical protein
VLYTTAARLTLAAPGGATIGGLTLPGYYLPTSSAGLASAVLGYVEQFATYNPPSGNESAGRRRGHLQHRLPRR